jgi:hypothetical protein
VLYHSGPTFGQVLYSCLDAFVVDASDYSSHLVRYLLKASEAFPTEWFLRNKSKSGGLHAVCFLFKNEFILQNTFTGIQYNLHCALSQRSNVWAILVFLSERLRFLMCLITQITSLGTSIYFQYYTQCGPG